VTFNFDRSRPIKPAQVLDLVMRGDADSFLNRVV
jgi:hypothetical protein